MPISSQRARLRCGSLTGGGRIGGAVSRYTCYQGRTIEIFGWTPDGRAVPLLPADVDGETAGDYAFINDRAMEWDGQSWVPLPWKDFAVWKLAHDDEAEPEESEGSAGLGQPEVALGDVVAIDLTGPSVDSGDGAVPRVIFDPAVGGS